jgi:hypothetical protein
MASKHPLKMHKIVKGERETEIKEPEMFQVLKII